MIQSWQNMIESEVIIKVLVIFGFVFLLWQWNFLEDLQDSNEFYPDGLDKCPPDTYTIHEDDSRRVKCFDCPVCPPGEEPSAPCGITSDTKPASECIPCKPGMYSDKVDSRSCIICSVCEFRNVISSCTSVKNTKCQDCPKRYYEDEKTHRCKPCYVCCPKSYAVLKECLISKRCKESCARSTSVRKNFKKKIARSANATYNVAFTKQHTKSLTQRNISKFDRLDSSVKNVSLTIVKRDLEADAESKRDQSSHNTESQTRNNSEWDIDELEKLDFLEIPDITKLGKEEGDQQFTDHNKNSNHPSTWKKKFNGTKIRAVEVEERVFSQTSLGENYITLQPTVAAPKKVTDLGEVTPHNDAAANEFLISTLGSFTGTIFAAVFLILMGLLIFFLYKKHVCKMLHDRKKFERTPSDSSDTQSTGETSDSAEGETTKLTYDEASTVTVSQGSWDSGEKKLDHMGTKNKSDASSTVDIESLPLSELPPDLENLLAQRLDVLHKSQYGWQKIGAAFKIRQHVLRHLKNEYKKDNGSPTCALMLILGTSKCIKLSTLLKALNSRKVNRPDVARMVRWYIKKANESQ